MTENFQKLRSNQRAALRLLITSGSTSVAAAAGGVTQQTVNRWLREDEAFRAAVRHAESAAMAAVMRRLLGLTDSALDAVEALLASETETVRLRAAEICFSRVLSWHERVATDARLADIEQMLADLEASDD